jgi:hypothetical protein
MRPSFLAPFLTPADRLAESPEHLQFRCAVDERLGAIESRMAADMIRLEHRMYEMFAGFSPDSACPCLDHIAVPN